MKSIRREMTLWLILGISLIMCGVGWVVIGKVEDSLTQEFDRNLFSKISTIATCLEEDEDGIDFEYEERALPEFGQSANPLYFEVLQENGDVVARSLSLGKDRLETPKSFSGPVVWDVKLPNGKMGRAVALQLVSSGVEDDGEEVADTSGFGPVLSPVVIVAADRERLDKSLSELVLAVTIAGIIALMVAALVVFLAIRRGLSPMIRLTKKVDAIDAATLSERLPETNIPRELRPLSAKLNECLSRLDESFRRERRMTVNMAHELRAPLAEIRSAADVATKWPEDDELTSEAVQVAREVSEEMGQVVDSLLRLSRSEIGTEDLESEVVNFAAKVEECMERYQSAAVSRGVRVQVQHDKDVSKRLRLATDPGLLDLVIRNLIDNAISHTPEQGRVVSSFSLVENQIVWSLSNGPVALSESELDRMWEPLWTKELSRSDRRHAGLGLTMVRSLADVLGFNIHFQLTDDVLTAIVAASFFADLTAEPEREIVNVEVTSHTGEA